MALRTAGMREQPALRFSLQVFAPRLGAGFASGKCTQHTLSVWSFVPHSHINSDRADTSRQRDPSARNLCQTMCRCVHSRCRTVTLTASRLPIRHAPTLVAWQSSRQCGRHPSCQPSAAADWKRWRGEAPAPTHPRMLAPFHPQGGSARIGKPDYRHNRHRCKSGG
jgi:hypothetical protein